MQNRHDGSPYVFTCENYDINIKKSIAQVWVRIANSEKHDGCSRKALLLDYSKSELRYTYGFENAIPLKDAVNGFFNPSLSYDFSTDYDYTKLELIARFSFVQSNRLDYNVSEINFINATFSKKLRKK